MADEQEYSLFGGSMLSEEQFHKMMADEDTKMQEEAQLRLMPRGVSPSDLPYTPSPPLVPEVTPKLPTPPPRGPFAPPPDGPAPETPFRRLPTPPRPRLDAGLQNPTPTDEQDQQDMQRENLRQQMDEKRRRLPTPEEQIRDMIQPPASPPAFGNRLANTERTGQNPIDEGRVRRNKAYEEFRNENEGPSPENPMDVRRKVRVAENTFTPTASDASPFAGAVELAQVYGPREDRYPDAGRLPQQYRDKQKDAPMIDFGATGRPPSEHKEPRLDYQDEMRRGERGFGLSPNELRRDRIVPPPSFDERFNVPPPEKKGPPLSQADEERYSPETAQHYFRSGAQLERTNRRLEAENGPQPNVAQRFGGDFLAGAMALLPPGGPRGTPFSRSIPRSEGVTSPMARVAREMPSEATDAPEMIKSPALKLRGQIYEGTDHGDAYIKAGEPADMRGFQDGFTTTHGRFVSRQEAMEIASRTDQTSRRPDPETKDPDQYRLQSEDLKAPAQKGPGGRPATGRGPMVQGNRVYGEQTGELGPKDAALRSVRRQGIPPEEAQTKNLDAFPEGYFDRVPRERRQMGAGLSHPGFRWQIMENGQPIGTTQMNKIKANQRADKLTSTYDKQYTVEPRAADERELTPSEKSYLDKYEIKIKRNDQ